jgi:hypothetical protein
LVIAKNIVVPLEHRREMMHLDRARRLLTQWTSLSQHKFIQVLDVIVKEQGGLSEWIRKNPDLLKDPLNIAVDPESLGFHQRPHWNLMPYSTVRFHGRRIYIFEHHIRSLLS